MIIKWLTKWIDMGKGHLKQGFMRAAGWTAIALVPVGLLVLSSVTPSDAGNSPKTSTSVQTLEQVAFEEAKDLAALVKTYPFLKKTVEEIVADNKTSGLAPTKIYVSKLKQAKQKNNVVMVSLRGPAYCGSGGCALLVYMDQGKGYTKVLDALSGDGAPLYMSPARDSLVTCGRQEKFQWQLKDGSFKNAAPYKGAQPLAPCR